MSARKTADIAADVLVAHASKAMRQEAADRLMILARIEEVIAEEGFDPDPDQFAMDHTSLMIALQDIIEATP